MSFDERKHSRDFTELKYIYDRDIDILDNDMDD